MSLAMSLRHSTVVTPHALTLMLPPAPNLQHWTPEALSLRTQQADLLAQLRLPHLTVPDHHDLTAKSPDHYWIELKTGSCQPLVDSHPRLVVSFHHYAPIMPKIDVPHSSKTEIDAPTPSLKSLSSPRASTLTIAPQIHSIPSYSPYSLILDCIVSLALLCFNFGYLPLQP